MARIQTNVSALNAHRNLGTTSSNLARSIQKLSSGFRINRAADDSAGLGIANKLRSDIRSMTQASRNAQQANSLLQVAEGGVQTISSILDRMKELATQAGSDNVDDAGRGRVKLEYDALKTEIQKIADTTKFQGKALLNGAFGTSLDTNVANSTALAAGNMVYNASIAGTKDGTYAITDQTGAANQLRVTFGTTTQTITLAAAGKQDVTFSSFGLTLNLDANFVRNSDGSANNTQAINGKNIVVLAGAGGGDFLVRSSGAYAGDDLISLTAVDVTTGASGLNLDSLTFTGNGTAAEYRTALTRLDTSIGAVNTAFGNIGSAQSRVDFATANVSSTIENVQAAESVIRDADLAFEMVDFTKNQILQQAGVAMLAQANAAPQGVLSLLAG